MALNAEVEKILNTQINKEIYSSYLYLTFADYYEGRGLKGYANWYMVQVQEELCHAMILRRYLLDNDCMPEMLAIDKPDKKFKNDLDPLKAGLEHERYVTSLINDCYAAAYEAKDWRTMKMLDWFIDEQGEEEVNATDMVTEMELFGSSADGLFSLDQKYAARSFTAPTSMPM